MTSKVSPAEVAASIQGMFKNVRNAEGPQTIGLLAGERKALRGPKTQAATKLVLDTRGNLHEVPRCQGTSARGIQCERAGIERGEKSAWTIQLAADDQRAYCDKHLFQHVSVKVLAAKAKAAKAPKAAQTVGEAVAVA